MRYILRNIVPITRILRRVLDSFEAKPAEDTVGSLSEDDVETIAIHRAVEILNEKIVNGLLVRDEYFDEKVVTEIEFQKIAFHNE